MNLTNSNKMVYYNRGQKTDFFMPTGAFSRRSKDLTVFCPHAERSPFLLEGNMPSGEKTKLLWKNLEYRKHMIEINPVLKKGYKHTEEFKRKISIYWKGKKDKRILIICKICNKEFLVSPSRKNRTKYCSRLCCAKGQLGENGSNWKGGKSFEPYPLGWSKTFKEQIRFRDGYKCQLCGCSEVENGRKLDVHHKDYNKINIMENNLISLCTSCHCKTGYNREYWIKYFEQDDHESGVDWDSRNEDDDR